MLTRWDRLWFIFINSLFSLWVISFWHYSWRTAMMQVSCALQIKQRLWPSPSPSSLLSVSETGLPPSSIVSCGALSSPSLLVGFLAFGSLHEVLAWEASGCSNDTVFTKLPSQGRHSPYQVLYHGPLSWWLIRVDCFFLLLFIAATFGEPAPKGQDCCTDIIIRQKDYHWTPATRNLG